MRDNMSCTLCYKEVFSGVGFGCLMCGMVLVDSDDNEDVFCSDRCRETFDSVHVRV